MAKGKIKINPKGVLKNVPKRNKQLEKAAAMTGQKKGK